MKKQSVDQYEIKGVTIAIILMAAIALLGKLITNTPHWLTAANSLSVVMMVAAAVVITLTVAVYKKVIVIKRVSKNI